VIVKQILGNIELRIGEELCVSHAFAWRNCCGAAIANDAVSVPDRLPELLWVVHRPAMQRPERLLKSEAARESHDFRLGDLFGAGSPKHIRHCANLAPANLCGIARECEASHMNATLSADTIRIFLHILAVTVWLGGQIVMLALLPVLRSAGVEGLPKQAAQAFQKVAWPAFGVAFFTGIWNIFAVDMANASTGWNMVFGFKFLLVLVSGAAAFVHAQTTNPKIKGMTGGIGFLAALVAMFLGFVMSH